MTVYELADKLNAAGHAIAASAISKVERGERQVSVDDLMAFASALGVSPSALLLPLTDQPTDMVEVTGGGAVLAADAWRWANGQRPLRLTPGKEQTELLEHQLFGMPQWLRSYRAELHERASADFPGQVETDPATGLPVIVLRRDPDGGTDG